MLIIGEKTLKNILIGPAKLSGISRNWPLVLSDGVGLAISL